MTAVTPRSAAVAPPPLAWQATLLGGGALGIDHDFAHAERLELSEGAWVDLVPGWVSGSDDLFASLLAEVPWRAREVPMYDRVVPEPRLSAWWGSGPSPSWPDGVAEMADTLTARYGARFDTFGANLYRDGSDSVAWHGDRGLREQDSSLVAVLSLGSARRFLLRPTGGGPSVRLDPAPGDLLVMGGTCQRTWQHAVPKSARPVGPRISVTLRPGRRKGDPEPDIA